MAGLESARIMMPHKAEVYHDRHIYLASPYSHPDADLRTLRFQQVCEIAGKLMVDGLVVFSPIAHTHPIAELCSLPSSWNYWHKYDLVMILGSCKVIVACMDGWRESKGLTAEIEIAHRHGVPVEYLVISGDQFMIETTPPEG
jgi:nucleoside 2-deoxyribosyltransferase